MQCTSTWELNLIQRCFIWNQISWFSSSAQVITGWGGFDALTLLGKGSSLCRTIVISGPVLTRVEADEAIHTMRISLLRLRCDNPQKDALQAICREQYCIYMYYANQLVWLCWRGRLGGWCQFGAEEKLIPDPSLSLQGLYSSSCSVLITLWSDRSFTSSKIESSDRQMLTGRYFGTFNRAKTFLSIF